MKLKIAFSYLLLINVNANIFNDFIIEYFKYKQVKKVFGFSCNSVEDDFMLVSSFIKNGIFGASKVLTKDLKIQLQADIKYWRLGMFLDVRCYNAGIISSLLLQASNLNLFGELHHWLILSSNSQDLLKILPDWSFGPSTDFVIAEYANGDRFELYDVYNLFKERGTDLNITFFGTWSRDNGLIVNLTASKLKRRSDMRGIELRASFFRSGYKSKNMSLEEYYEDYAHATIEGASKCGYHILSHLSDLYNFTLKTHQAPKWEKGDPVGPVARDLQNNKADFTGTALAITMKRSEVVKSVHQIWPFRTCFMFRNPQPTTIKVQEMFRPFKNEIWSLFIMTALVSLAALSLNLKYEGIDCTLIRFSNSFLITMGALCQQCTDTKMDHISTRLSFLSLMVFSLLMYTYYSSTVVSARLDEPVYKINDSLNELGKLELKFSSEWMDYLDYFLKRPDWDALTFYTSKWTKLPEDEKFTPPSVGMRKVKEGGFAYHTHPHVGYPFIEKLFSNREICELTEVNVARPVRTSFGLRINSTIVEISRVGFTKISEVGLRNRQVTRWSHRKPVCRKDILSASSLNIYEFAPHLILLVLGMTGAVLVYALEVIVDRHFSNDYLAFRHSLHQNYYDFRDNYI